VVDHGRRADDPRVALPGLGILALLGAEDGRLLLGLADEQDPFGLVKARQVLSGDVVFALLLGEGDYRDGACGGEGVDGLDESIADGGEQGRGGDEVSAVVAEEADHAEVALELGDVDVEVHAVDALDFQGDVVPEDVGDGLGYTHGWVLVAGGRKANRPLCGP
jgi:hypothetical protein